ncbi:SDR family NAD(P)-dependent oxidoreductase [Paenibacillus sp. UMB4589-SE434]|uniref:type I polyketide synthase n=1 Tax=Paenibacillus sp. UMB4589-SE434 TaxID=3046314 RepID=UPI00254C4AC7|nr:SDR family NAD(P)-dependent oxidoreductase [Paenibacillus sp. UMB4589-SE434]MDK8180489.1 SDR family NAD(P)-dependent oxidoreductase [Paenibacillus sp. UMB4589-SE434]
MDFSSITLKNSLFEESAAAPDPFQSDVDEAYDIAIIGIGLKLPLADTVEQYWHNLREGKDCVRDLPEARRKDTDRYFYHIGKDPHTIQYGAAAYVEGIDQFDYGYFKLSPKEAALMDPNQRLFLQTAWKAIEDAGYGGAMLTGSNTGVYLGYGSDADYKNMISLVEPEAYSMSMPGNVRPMIASRIAYLLDLKGPNMTVDTTCSSSLVAIHLACQAIRNGECDLAIAGGIQLHLIPVRDFEVGVESSTSRTRALDDSADGTGTGEGAVAILLKPLRQAQEDRDAIYAVIKSSAVNQDGTSVGITAPNAEAQEQVLAEAWSRANINPEAMGYIEIHGTGTKLGDPIEMDGIRRAFQRYTNKVQFCAISGVKSNIGHLDSSAGIAGLVKAALSLKYKELFPTLHFMRPNRKISFEDSPVYVNDKLREWTSNPAEKRCCGVSSFGISGTNCHIVLEEANQPVKNRQSTDLNSAPRLQTDKKEYIFVLSALTRDALQQSVKDYIHYLDVGTDMNLSDLCYTLQTGRGEYQHRLAVVTGSSEHLRSTLLTIQQEGLRQGQVHYYYYDAGPESDSDRKELSLAGNRALLNYMESDQLACYQVAEKYTHGAEIQWNTLYRRVRPNRLHAPSYPFEGKRCWLNLADYDQHTTATTDDNRYYHTVWQPQPLSGDYSAGMRRATTLVFKNDDGAAAAFNDKLRQSGTTVIEVGYAGRYKQVDRDAYLIEDSEADYDKLLQQLKERNVRHIVFMCTIQEATVPATLTDLQNRLESGVYRLHRIIKAIIRQEWNEALELTIIARRGTSTIGGKMQASFEGLPDPLLPEHASLFGFSKAIGWEYPYIHIRCLDMDSDSDMDCCIHEINTPAAEYVTAYRQGIRYVERLDKLDLPNPNKEMDDNQPVIKPHGVYVISGGLGGIGLHIARYLASQQPVQIILLNRSPFPEQTQWNHILQEQPTHHEYVLHQERLSDHNHHFTIDNSYDVSHTAVHEISNTDPSHHAPQMKQHMTGGYLSRTIATLQEIERSGSKIVCIQADITSETHIKAIMDDIRSRYGFVTGVIHAAGIAEGDISGRLTQDHFEKVMAAKVQGTWVLDQVLRDDNLEFLALFSSAITLVGGMGSGPYTAANAYLDAVAANRSLIQGKRTFVLNWPAWDNTGLSENSEVDEDKELFKVLPVKKGIEAFADALRHEVTQMYVGPLNVNSVLFQLGDKLPFRMTERVQEQLEKRVIGIEAKDHVKGQGVGSPALQIKASAIALKGKADSHYTNIERSIAEAWRHILGYEELDIHANFFEIGGDSILVTKVHALVEAQYPGMVTISDMFSYATIAKLAEYVSFGLQASAPVPMEEEDRFEAEVSAWFDHIEAGTLTIAEAVERYRLMEVVRV